MSDKYDPYPPQSEVVYTDMDGAKHYAIIDADDPECPQCPNSNYRLIQITNNGDKKSVHIDTLDKIKKEELC